jgi:hypothetical protein
MNEWQYTNQFFEEGKFHQSSGGSVTDCPYNYLSIEQDDDKKVQSELYRQQEWLAGFHQSYKDKIFREKKIA